MATVDRLNWVNQAVEAVARLLRTSPELMDSLGLAGGKGVVRAVDTHDIDRDRMEGQGVVYAACAWGGNGIASYGNAARATDWVVRVAVHLEGKLAGVGSPAGVNPARASDRMGLKAKVQRAVPVLAALVNQENQSTQKLGGLARMLEVEDATPGNVLDPETGEYYTFADTAILVHLQVLD